MIAHTGYPAPHGKKCVDCHIRVPHGGKVPRLLTGANAPSRYKPDGNGGGFGANYMTSAILPASGTMVRANVSCVGAGCAHSAYPVAGGKSW